ncbi:glycosyltransferase [Candidatus Woesearchaeota archaeon]|nr:glycosyltransferase [Candidatus Woesearchaeota archaeon]
MSKRKEIVSIVIPTLNEEKNIDNLLSNISGLKKSSERVDFDLEVLVADANSLDRTRSIAEFYGAKIIPGGIPGRARNQGAKAANGNIVYFMDADICIEDQDFLSKSYSEFIKRGLYCAGMNNYLLWKGDEKQISKSAAQLVFGIANMYIKGVQNTNQPKAVATCMMADKQAFLELGGFDENIYWGEDSELAQRFARLGYKFGILNSVSVKVSPRKAVAQGPARFAKNVLRLNAYRSQHGEVSREIYNRLTGIQDYFARADLG